MKVKGSSVDRMTTLSFINDEGSVEMTTTLKALMCYYSC